MNFYMPNAFYLTVTVLVGKNNGQEKSTREDTAIRGRYPRRALLPVDRGPFNWHHGWTIEGSLQAGCRRSRRKYKAVSEKRRR